MLAALAAVLALAGAPASTSVGCNPAIDPTELGITFPSYVNVAPDGHITPGPLDRITLGTIACGALLYTSASPTERAAIRRLNPATDFDQLVGVGLQVALHESNHVALNSLDECAVEKTTRQEVDSLIVRYADSDRVGATEGAATASDASLPPQYHGC